MKIKEGFILEKAEKSEEIKVGEWGMHGDVVIQRVESVPDGFNKMNKEPLDCLAYGEVTGHAHKLFGEEGSFDLRVDPTEPTKRHLRVLKPVALRHQEHKEIIIFPGDYGIRIQKEYDPFAKRNREVAD